MSLNSFAWGRETWEGKPESFPFSILNALILFQYDLLIYKFLFIHVYIIFKYCIYVYIQYTCNI